MKKYAVMILFAVICITPAKAQHVEKGLSKVDFFMPGYTYELGVGKKTTLMANASVGGYIGWGGGETLWGMNPQMNLEYRYYYNFERRERLNKKTRGNCANFFAPKFSFYFPGISSRGNGSDNYEFSFGGVYGLQRTYDNGVYILGEIGIVAYSPQFDISPIGALKIGFVFNHKENR